jgi:hypothetical protein
MYLRKFARAIAIFLVAFGLAWFVGWFILIALLKRSSSMIHISYSRDHSVSKRVHCRSAKQ